MGDAISPAYLAAALIGVFEGCRLTAYQDSGEVWTIGYGHTGPVNGQPIAPGLTITEQQAADLFAEDVAPLLAKVQDQKLIAAAALISFGYNCGMSKLEEVLAGQSFMSQFVHDRNGNVLPGLQRRRHLEETLYLVSQQLS